MIDSQGRVNKPVPRIGRCNVGDMVTLKGAMSSDRPMYYGETDGEWCYLWRNKKSFDDKKLADCVAKFCHEVIQ